MKTASKRTQGRGTRLISPWIQWIRAAISFFLASSSSVPSNVYRAKGILHFSDTASLFLFQYAYREMQFVRIAPQAKVPNVAVFIGENFSKDAVKAALEHLLMIERWVAF